MKLNKLEELPDTIRVNIAKTKLGKYFIKLPEYDVFTESDSLEEIDFFINDLIFTLFDVPKALQAKIIYRAKKERPTDLTKVDLTNVNSRQLLRTSDIATRLTA